MLHGLLPCGSVVTRGKALHLKGCFLYALVAINMEVHVSSIAEEPSHMHTWI